MAERRDAHLVVLHSTDSGVAVQNGPSASIATQLGNPLWAQIHLAVEAAGADPSTTTTYVSGAPLDELVVPWADKAHAVYLGPRRSRIGLLGDTKRRLSRRFGGLTIERVHNGQPSPIASTSTASLPRSLPREKTG